MTKIAENKSRILVLETFAVFTAVSLLAAIIFHRPAFVILSIVILLVALFMKSIAGQITCWWLKFSSIVACINSRVILVIIFYFVLTPIAFIYRKFNIDTLGLEMKKSGSFYIERDHIYSKTDLEKMW